jgi:hypothetical protein
MSDEKGSNTEGKTSKSKNAEESFKSAKANDDTFGKLRENPWIVSTIVLGIALVIVLIVYNGGTGMVGNTISEQDAGQNLVDFISARGSTAEIMSVEKDGSLYKAMVSIEDQLMPVYVTLDGKYAIIQPILLTEEVNATDTTDTTDTGTTPPATEVPKTAKPKVELFVMSHCPYGTQIEKGMIPVVEKLGSKIDFSVKFVNYAMHGEKELDEQLNQYCIEKEQNSKYLTYLKCFLKEGDGAACLTEAKIDAAKLKACTDKADAEFNVTANFNDQSKWLSGRYPPFLVHDAENEAYGVQGSPTLIINGVDVSSGRDSASLLTAVCGAFTTAPAECSQTIDSTSPSPGFGYTAATGTATDATCG